MYRLRFKLWHVFFLLSLVGLVCAIWVDLDRKNRNLHEQLERSTTLHVEDWDINQLVKILENDYGVRVKVDGRLLQRKLDDVVLDQLRLKNSLRVLLYSADLSFTTNYTSITIIEFDESDDWHLAPAFSDPDNW